MESKEVKTESLGIYYFVGFLIPILGIIIGLMKFTKDEESGKKILLFSIGMIFVNAFIIGCGMALLTLVSI